MNISEDALVMHQSVGPVKIEVVEDERENEAEDEIGDAIGGDVVIALSDAAFPGGDGEVANKGKDHHRAHRIEELMNKLFVFREFLLDE